MGSQASSKPRPVCSVHRGENGDNLRTAEDSGGGLFRVSPANSAEKTQVQIVSYGDAQCFSAESGVFTDVAAVHPWIDREVKRLQSLCEEPPACAVLRVSRLYLLGESSVVRAFYGADDTYAVKGFMCMLCTVEESYNAQLVRMMRRILDNPSFNSTRRLS